MNLKTKIVSIDSQQIPKELGGFFSSLYSNENNYDFLLSELEVAYAFCASSVHVHGDCVQVFEDSEIVGHVALIRDDRFEYQEAFFGFFESVENEEVLSVLWTALGKLAKEKKIKKIHGPVSGSIWHQYRCVSETSETLHTKTEPHSPVYYYNFLNKQSPVDEIKYTSGKRTSLLNIVKLLEEKNIDALLERNNFSISSTGKLGMGDLASIALISSDTFSAVSWGYVQLEQAEFGALYNMEKINSHIHKVFFLYHETKPIGFCSVIEPRKGVWACKTICIASGYQGIGLGNALAYYVHKEAIEEKVEEIQYLLVREGNQVHNYSMADLEIFRRYSVFTFNI